MHELPLVFFTVFTQSAVGAFILLLIGGAMGLVAPRRKAIGLFSVMCLFGLGVIVGIFHVGQPLRALNMLLRVGHDCLVGGFCSARRSGGARFVAEPGDAAV